MVDRKRQAGDLDQYCNTVQIVNYVRLYQDRRAPPTGLLLTGTLSLSAIQAHQSSAAMVEKNMAGDLDQHCMLVSPGQP